MSVPVIAIGSAVGCLSSDRCSRLIRLIIRCNPPDPVIEWPHCYCPTLRVDGLMADVPTTDDLEYIFQRRSSAPITAMLCFGGGILAFVFAAFGMLVAFVGNVGPVALQAMTTLPILLGLAALTAGWSQVRAPTEVSVGPDGLTWQGRGGRYTESWERIGWATIGTGALNHKRQLVVYDVDGKTITRISEAFDDFDGLADLVKQRIAARGDDTADRLQLQKSRRTALFCGGVAVVLLGVAAANVWNAREQQRTAEVLAAEGVPGQADVVRRFLAPNGITRRLEYRVTDPAAADEVRNAEVTPDYWESLENAATVPVIVVPNDPEISRLAEGEVPGSDRIASPTAMYGISALVGVVSLFLIAAACLQWGGWDIDLDSKTGKLSIKRFGTGR